MQIISSIDGMQRLSLRLRKQGKTIGFVPTMGYLHQGHFSLIRKARAENDFLVISIFVNPLQFGPAEDFNRYPRDFKRDKKLAEKEKVNCIFHPAAKDMYSQNYKTFVYVEDLSLRLCGAFRPGHFKGVTTAVARLFNIVNPHIAYFGRKDAQQAIIIKKMSKDLNFPLKIKILPTVREKDGLAMSSRNKYLSAVERKEAPVLYAGLRNAVSLIKKGIRDADKVKAAVLKMIRTKKTARVEYVEIVDIETLQPVKKIKGEILIALACRFGRTRLIDNIVIKN
jgi:pantoate--beta-alanine ligase